MPTKPPNWPKVRPPTGKNYHHINQILGQLQLVTVCQEALCPNIGECWNSGTATFMLMGDTCTRACRFCAVKTGNPRGQLDPDEPTKVAQAITKMQLDYVVLTSVDRDDLADLGSGHFAQTVKVIKQHNPTLIVEALTPDFNGQKPLVAQVMASGIEVFAHNIETVERLTPQVRDRRSGYHQSLTTLHIAKTMAQEHQYTKSSIMLGLGERDHEVQQALTDLRHVGCAVVTFGQYLAPTRRHKKHLPIQEYVAQEKFDYFREMAENMGFLYVASGPLVRSSYRAGEFFMRAMIERKRTHPPKKSEPVAIEHWGELAYQQAHQRQKQYLNEIILGQRPETIALCSHPPVITLGKGTPPGELSALRQQVSVEVYPVERGGKATYHGPGQVVCYPLINLKNRGQNIAGLLCALEASIVRTLSYYSLNARGNPQRGNPSLTGVWVGEQKVASIGVAVKRWVTYHGLALNLYCDPLAFQGIAPCGYSPQIMTSMEALLGRKLPRKPLEDYLVQTLLSLLPTPTSRPSVPSPFPFPPRPGRIPPDYAPLGQELLSPQQGSR